MSLTIAALASGTGSNIEAICACIEGGRLDARMALVLSNAPEAPVLDKARARGIPVWARDHKEYADRVAFDQELLARIRESGADCVVLAGYMRLLSPFFVGAFAGRILNIHPALLPAFPGARAGADALAYGARITGVSVHFVDESMDNGPVIIQAALPVHDHDTLESLMARIHALEHRIYPQALQWLAEKRLLLEGRRVILLPGRETRETPYTHGAKSSGAWLVSPGLEGF